MGDLRGSPDPVLHARRSEARALTAFGKRLLVGDGVAPDCNRALAVLGEAALRGEGEACRHLATCAAWGVGQPRNLERALDYLEQAAQLGWNPAQQELRLLARGLEADPATVRRRIDLAGWRRAPAGRVICNRPRLIAIERFLSTEECQWVIECGRCNLTRAKVYRSGMQAQSAQTRTNTEAAFTIFQASVALSLIRDRMAAATGYALAHFEIAKLLHYGVGEHFAVHADFLDPRVPQFAREIELHGQRATTFLVYLNDDYEGGETEFPVARLRYRGRCGDALLFSNVDVTGAPDPASIHAGLPPTRGEKWLLSQWIRSRPIDSGAG